MSTLDDRLWDLSCVPILLVATDYDGTISPIVEEPARARPCREAIVALRMLSSLPQTHVAVISGRALADLAELAGLPEDVHLVGSHGSEFDLDYASALPQEAKVLRERVTQELSEITENGDGLFLEEKPASVALHYRAAPPEQAEQALSAAVAGPGSIEGVYTKHGKKVVEFCVVATNKGAALETVRHRCGASAAIFLGDDRTDEDAFARLCGPDVAVKVGPGESIAPFRVESPAEVARLLARLGERRAAWLAGADATPIDCHALLSDQRALALVTPVGQLSWLCAPRADSPPIFADLIGGAAAGHFTVRPASEAAPGVQRYDADSFILQTSWPTLTVTDLLDCSAGRPDQRPGRADLIRVVEATEPFIIEFAPRLDFGRVPTRLRCRDGGLEIEDTHDPIVLRAAGVTWSIEQEGVHHTARAQVQPTQRQPIVLELRYGSGRLRDDRVPVEDRIRLTRRFWSAWSERLEIPSIQSRLVRRSALVLKALCHGPSGAVLAAATTSLPEHIGGVRNWDYRYCWLRDAAMSAASLVRLGSLDEAMAFLNWMCGVVDTCESPERLQPLYTVTGGELGPEADITELSGYRGSRPVRIGNAASRQVQLDVFGPIVDLIALLLEKEAPLSADHWRLVEAMVTAVERRWQEPDHGIWEIRRPRRHHVHSKIMCWLTVDRAITIADHFLERDMPRWIELRSQIASDILEHGFKPSVRAFTAAYDDVDLDAASLHVGLSGLLPPDDDRFHSTIEAVRQELQSGPTVYRYRADDGLPGFEGGFHICTAWLIHALLITGRRDDARRIFDDLCSVAGPIGMLSEQYDPKQKRALGNVPQAYSHVAIIDSAIHLANTA
jgi:trehalose 6-phosphate phosphatase